MTITIEPTAHGFRLMATKHGFTAPAGPRLFRAKPWPFIPFTHPNRESAEIARAALQEYVDKEQSKISKAKARKEGA